MDKMKKSLGIKILAAVLLSITLLGMVASGLLVCHFVREGVYEYGGRQRYRQMAIEDIMDEYDSEAIQAYSDIYLSDCDNANQRKAETDVYFAEENCNYFYRIEPHNEAASDCPTVSNYYTDAYDYGRSRVFSLTEELKEYTFVYAFPETLVRYIQGVFEGNGSVRPSESESKETDAKQEKYINDKFEEYRKLFLEDDDCFVINYENLTYDLKGDFAFRQAFVNFMDTIDIKKYNQFVFSLIDVDCHMDYQMRMVIAASCNKEFQLTGYVKSDLTADDKFHNLFSKYGLYKLIDYVGIIFAVTGIVSLLLVVFLVIAAGHHKASEELRGNALDRIPYDVVLGILIWLGISAIRCNDYGQTAEGVGIALILIFLIPYLVITTATRIKLGSLVKNTVIYRLLVLAKRGLKKIGAATKYFYSGLNCYIKYIGVYVAISLVEFFMVCAQQDANFMGTLWFLEKLLIIAAMAVALINMDKLKKGAGEMADGSLDSKIDTEKMLPVFKEHGENLNRIQDGVIVAVEERLKSERFKTELITNVSHDIKTPLTSIISYVDLLKKENIEGKKAKEYIEVLERQSAKLKKLIQDLMDASKASTGNLPVHMEKMELKVLVDQVIGEFEERFAEKKLSVYAKYCSNEIAVMADGNLLWRIFDNLFTNIYKYAQENTRVYIDVACGEQTQTAGNTTKMQNTQIVNVAVKNISKEALNITGDELMERFVRGDSSRNTEGSGLGLSIAKSLIELLGGTMEIQVDGDLFKVVLSLVCA